MDSNVEKSQQRKCLLYSLRIVICGFQIQKKSKIDNKTDKRYKIFIFSLFTQFLSNFRQTSWIGTLKTFIMAKNCSPVVFYEETSAVFGKINLELTPKLTKNAKFLQVFLWH